MSNQIIQTSSRRSFLKNFANTTIVCSSGLAFESQAQPNVIYIGDLEGQYADSQTVGFTDRAYIAAHAQILRLVVIGLRYRLKNIFSARYPTYDIDAALRSVLKGSTLLTSASLVDANMTVSETKYVASFASNIGVALALGFGEQLVQFELMKRGMPERAAKWAAPAATTLLTFFYSMFAVPSVMAAVTKVIFPHHGELRRRRLQQYAGFNISPIYQITDNLKVTKGVNLPGWSIENFVQRTPTASDDSVYSHMSPVYALYEDFFVFEYSYDNSSVQNIYINASATTRDGAGVNTTHDWSKNINVDYTKVPSPPLKP